MTAAELDRRVLLLARTRGHTPTVDRAVALFSRLGEHAAGWLIIGAWGSLTARDPARRRLWRRGMATVAGAYVANQALKFTIRRPRPRLPGLPPLTATVSSLSFPSAHATTAFAATRAYRGLVPGWLLWATALAIATSRPYLGVHYPSDVLAGAVLGRGIGELGRLGPAGVTRILVFGGSPR